MFVLILACRAETGGNTSMVTASAHAAAVACQSFRVSSQLPPLLSGEKNVGSFLSEFRTSNTSYQAMFASTLVVSWRNLVQVRRTREGWHRDPHHASEEVGEVLA